MVNLAKVKPVLSRAGGRGKADDSMRQPENTPQKGDTEDIKGFLEEQAEGMAEKMMKGGGGEAMDAFDETSSAMTRMLDGGGKPLEMIQVAISFLQSFSLVALIEMDWPGWFTGFKMFTLDLAFMKDAGEWPTIFIGLLTAPLLILQLDHGLFVRRNDNTMVQTTVSNEFLLKKRRNVFTTVTLVCIFWIMGFVLFRGLSAPGFIGGFVISLLFIFITWNLQAGYCLPVVEGARESLDKITLRIAFVFVFLLGAFGLASKKRNDKVTRVDCIEDVALCSDEKSKARLADVYSIGLIFFILIYTSVQLFHWTYLRRLLKTCRTTNQNFKISRCTTEFTLFLFLYLIAYLAGVNSSLAMAIMQPVEAVNSTDCAAFVHTACGIDKQFVLTDQLCLGKPVYKSPLIIYGTGHADYYMAEFSEIAYFTNDVEGYWVNYEHTLPVDKETFLPIETRPTACGTPGRSKNVLNFYEDNEYSFSRVTGGGCRWCSDFRTSNDWMCHYKDPTIDSSSVLSALPGEHACFSWEANHHVELCNENCMKRTNVLGWILFVFFAILPLFRLGNIGYSVKKIIKEECDEKKIEFEEGFAFIAGRARATSTHTDFLDISTPASASSSTQEGEDSKAKFGLKYKMRHLPFPIKFWEDSHDIIKRDYGQQVAISTSLLAAFEERWWWWKIYLMAERALLAAAVFTEVSVWVAFAVTAFGWAASKYTNPYWEDDEDSADLIARGTTLITVFFACLAETEVISGNEIVVSVILNLCAAGTLAILIAAIGPRRLFYSIISYYRVKKRQVILEGSEDAAEVMTEKEVEDMGDDEFLAKSVAVRTRLMKHFQDHLIGETKFLRLVQKEHRADFDKIDVSHMEILETAAQEFGKSRCWLYSPANGTMIGVKLSEGRVTEINWRGEGLILKEGKKIPEVLKNLSTCKVIDLGCNNVYLDVKTNCGDSMNLDKKKFIVTDRQNKDLLEKVATKLGKTLEWLHNGHDAHNVEKWRGVEFTKDYKIYGISWPGEGLKGKLPDEICELVDLKRLDLRFNNIVVKNNDAINSMVDPTMPAHWEDTKYVRIKCESEELPVGLHFWKPKGDGRHGTRKKIPCLGHRPRSFHLVRQEGDEDLVRIENVKRPGWFLLRSMMELSTDWSMGKTVFSEKQQKSQPNYASLYWAEDDGKNPDKFKNFGEFRIVPALSGTEGYVSFKSEGSKFPADGLDRYISFARAGRTLGVRVAGTKINKQENKGYDFSGPVLWPKDFSFKLMTYKEEIGGKGAPSGNTRAELAHGWKSGLVNWKVSDMINRMEDDSSFKFDNNKDKVALCDMARKFGKSIDWLMNGKGGYKSDWWRGVIVQDGKVVGLDWRHEKLRGKIPQELLHFKDLKEVNFLDNPDLSKELTDDLLKMQKKMGRDCELFDPRDDMNILEVLADSIWRLPWNERGGWNKLNTSLVLIVMFWLLVGLAGQDSASAWVYFMGINIILAVITYLNFARHSKGVSDGKDRNQRFKEGEK